VQPVARQVLGYVQAERLKITAIIIFELLSGAAEGRRAETIRKWARNSCKQGNSVSADPCSVRGLRRKRRRQYRYK